MGILKLSMEKIVVTGEMQNREELNPERVAYFAELFRGNELVDPVSVTFDGQRYWLWDGFHRHRGADEAGETDILADVQPGTKQDAEWMACGANKQHDRGGLFRTNADKIRALHKALALKPDMSDSVIAEHCGVHVNTVRKHRQVSHNVTPEQTYRTGIDGKKYPPPPPPRFDPRPPPGTPAGPPPSMPQTGPEPRRQLDKVGYPIPIGTPAESSWAERGRVQDLLTRISQVRSELERAEEAKDKTFVQVRLQGICIDLGNAYRNLKVALPYATCPYCRGNGCQNCRMRGVVSEFSWNTVCAQELKDAMLREAEAI